MNKDFSQSKLLSFSDEKQIRILYDLAGFIETTKASIESQHFKKLAKYHSFLSDSKSQKITKLGKEFAKIKSLDYQFQVYIMLLERLLGQSKKEYQFIVEIGDEQTPKTKPHDIICILDSVRSAHNVGAIIRTSECFNIKQIIMTGLTPFVDSIQVQKTSMGCSDNIECLKAKSTLDCIEELKEKNYKIIAIETAKEAIDINSFNYTSEPIALIFGHEQFGISLEVLKACDQVISIPLYGLKNSLNVSIAHGVVLSHLINK